MMVRLTKRLAGIALAGMLACGLGTSAPEPLNHSGRQWLSAIPQAALRVGDAILSPAAAEAAVTEKSPEKVSPPASAAAKKKALTPGAKKTKAKPGRSASRQKKNGKERPKTAGKRCEPQSLTYARQRSGNMSSRTGRENGPLTWFSSEQKLGKTSDEPAPGSILILGADKRHGMPTGHVAYVEEVYPEGPSSYRIIFSHTNYDRQCSLETTIEAHYNSAAMTLDIFSGAWKAWGRGLSVAGFIHG